MTVWQLLKAMPIKAFETMVLDIHDQDSKSEAVKRQILRAVKCKYQR
jgi:hypothetical protein